MDVRRIVLLLGLMAVMMAVFATAALAVNKAGTQGDDELEGTSGEDRLYGLNGADVIRGFGDDDYLEGGRGDDLVYGNDGNDKIYLGGGNDLGVGGPGNDSLHAVDGVEGNDFVNGNGGTNDRCYVDSANEAGSGCEHRVCRGRGDIEVSTKASEPVIRDPRARKAPAVTFGPPNTGKIHARSSIRTPFRPFQSRDLRTSDVRSTKEDGR